MGYLPENRQSQSSGEADSMRKVALNGLLAGGLFGAAGWICPIRLMGAALSQDEIRGIWKLVFIVLCLWQSCRVSALGGF
jgi:hypothetical protein